MEKIKIIKEDSKYGIVVQGTHTTMNIYVYVCYKIYKYVST